MAVRDNWLQRIRGLLGSPPETEYPTSDINADIADAIRWYSRKNVTKRIGTITTVADQQNYLPEATSLFVLDVYYSGGITDVSFFDTDLPVALLSEMPPGGLLDLDFHSLSVGTRQQLKQFRDYYGKNWDFIDGEIYLVPAPTASGDLVYYLYASLRTEGEIPSADEDAVVFYAAAMGLRKLGMKREKIPGVRRSGGVQTYGSSDLLIKQADSFEKRAQETIRRYMGGL